MKKRRPKPHAAREHPEAAGLEASLHHVSGWPVLSITDSPQTLELELVNRMPHPVTAGPARLRLLFRPGILTELEKIALAPQSEAAWTLTVHPAKPHEPHGEVTLKLAGVNALTLAPGESIAIRIDGISADARGGSRATRVQLDYSRFFLESGVEAAGSQLMHLPVLRRHELAGVPATELRTGSTAVSGPFIAGFLDGPDLVNDDGKTENTLTLRIVNNTGRPIPLSADDDAATRFYVSFRTGTKNAEWGLLGSHSDHLDLSVEQDGWQVDNHTIRRTSAAAWERDEFLDLELTIHTAARTGDAQLIVTFENLPAHDDGDLVLLAHLGPIATRKDSVEVAGDLSVSGLIRSGANHPVITPAKFKLGGSIDRFYPVVFEDLDWAGGEFRFEVFRAETHVDGKWRGSMMTKVICHNDNFGHGSGYWSIEVRQSTASGEPTRHFVGSFASYPSAPKHILWLAGDTTYSWVANHNAQIVGLAELNQPDVIAIGAGETLRSYPVKTAPDDRFRAEYVSISESLGRDTGPVPMGAILMWSGSKDKIPLGWALCDGTKGTPDLRGRFIVGAGAGTYDHDDDTKESFDFPAAPTEPEKKPIAGQTGGRLRVTLPRHHHSGETHQDGAHYHHVPIWRNSGRKQMQFNPGNGWQFSYASEVKGQDADSAPTTAEYPSAHAHQLTIDTAGEDASRANLPPYFALCFIMKL